MYKIKKRDGRMVDFDKSKIEKAIMKAFVAVEGELSDYATSKAENIASYIENIAKEKELSIEEIQDYVEKGLMSIKKKDVAKAYILYRNERNKNREKNSVLRKQVKEKLTAANVQNQNANVDEYSFGGRMGEANSVQTRAIALDELISDMAKNNHLNNRIYIHDLDSYAVGSHNCLSIPFDDLLAKGFNTRQTDVRPANSINTAFQLVAVIFQLQSLQQFGGVAATHLDWTMVPYVRKSFFKHYRDGLKYICGIDNWNFNDLLEDINYDNCTNYTIIDIKINDYDFYSNEADDAGDFNKAYRYAMEMTEKELKQAVEGMYHNLNTLQSRSGNQLKWMAG